MNIQDELCKLESIMQEGLTPTVQEHIARIKQAISTPEDNAALEDFVQRHLQKIETDIEEMEQACFSLIEKKKRGGKREGAKNHDNQYGNDFNQCGSHGERL